MPLVKKPMQGFKIDGRVSIAMDALSNKEKKVIGGVLSDRDHFIASTSDPRKVRKLSEERTRLCAERSVGTEHHLQSFRRRDRDSRPHGDDNAGAIVAQEAATPAQGPEVIRPLGSQDASQARR